MSKKWFVRRVQSGKEDTVKRNLEKRVNAEGAQDVIASVLVPTESVAESGTVLPSNVHRLTMETLPVPGIV